MIKIAAATENGCVFCQDIALAQALKGKLGTEKFPALVTKDEHRESAFTEKERAVRAVIRKHFGETEVIEIFALNAFEQFYNALTIPLRIESDELQKLAERKV